MNDAAEKVLALVERRNALLADQKRIGDEIARIEAAFSLALSTVEKPRLLTAIPKERSADRTKHVIQPSSNGKMADELKTLAPHYEILNTTARKMVEARARGDLPEKIARDLGTTAKTVSVTISNAKHKLLAAREGRTAAAPRAKPTSDEEPHPAAKAARPVVIRSEVLRPRPPRDTSEPNTTTTNYFHDLRQHAILTREEEAEIFAEWKRTGDRRLADRLVASNLRLVVSIARQYRAKRHALLDLVQEGSVGLFHALSKYDPMRGIRFTSYASYWIKAYILKYMLLNHHIVKIGTTQAQRKLFYKLKSTRAALEKSGEVATPEQIAEALEVTPKEVVEMEQRMGSSAASLDAPIRETDDKARFYEFPATEEWRPDVRVESRDFETVARKHIMAFGDTLDGRMRIVFDKRLVAEDPATLAELAIEFGVTRERARQIEEKVKAKLKNYLKDRLGAVAA